MPHGSAPNLHELEPSFINSQAGASLSLLVVAILRQKPLNPVEGSGCLTAASTPFPRLLGYLFALILVTPLSYKDAGVWTEAL